jgi:hypothetical protein
MRKAIAYLRTHPIVALGIVVLIGAAYYYTRSPAPEPAATTPPPGAPQAQPAAPAAPAPAASPAPSPTPRATGGAADAGRPDPFAPLVRPAAPGSGPGLPVPPPAPLPPPLFPGQQPGQPAPPPPPVRESRSAQLMGLVGDTGSAAVIKLGTETFIVSPGDLIRNKIRVTVIDANKGLVILEEEGERFELKMGGVSGAHVAA